MATNEEIKDKHTGSTETKDGFVCETCGAKFRTDYELLAHQGNPVIYTQKDMDEARADQFRKDTDERVQSIKEARQEQLAEDIKLLEGILAKPSGYYYYNGDGEEVKSYICEFCVHLPLNEEHEIAAHMKYCKCYECEGYSKEPYFKKSVLITALQALQQSKVKN